jgi:uncharacterized protein YodC (DUF2158 family)
MKYHEIHVGQVVTLKSASVPMTVESMNHLKETIGCVWFEGKTLQRGVFRCEILKKF